MKQQVIKAALIFSVFCLFTRCQQPVNNEKDLLKKGLAHLSENQKDIDAQLGDIKKKIVSELSKSKPMQDIGFENLQLGMSENTFRQKISKFKQKDVFTMPLTNNKYSVGFSDLSIEFKNNKLSYIGAFMYPTGKNEQNCDQQCIAKMYAYLSSILGKPDFYLQDFMRKDAQNPVWISGNRLIYMRPGLMQPLNIDIIDTQAYPVDSVVHKACLSYME